MTLASSGAVFPNRAGLDIIRDIGFPAVRQTGAVYNHPQPLAF